MRAGSGLCERRRDAGGGALREEAGLPGRWAEVSGGAGGSGRGRTGGCRGTGRCPRGACAASMTGERGLRSCLQSRAGRATPVVSRARLPPCRPGGRSSRLAPVTLSVTVAACL